MKKPIPTQIKFGFGAVGVFVDNVTSVGRGEEEGWIKLDGKYLEMGHGEETPDDPYSSVAIEVRDKAQAAYILLSLAKVLLDQVGNPDVSKKALLESGLLEDSSQSSSYVRNVRNGSNRSESNDNPNVRNVDGSLTGSLLTQEVNQLLLDSGIPGGEVQYLGTMNGCADALNKSTNPVKAALTMTAKPGFKERYAAWSRRNPKAVVLPELP